MKLINLSVHCLSAVAIGPSPGPAKCSLHKTIMMITGLKKTTMMITDNSETSVEPLALSDGDKLEVDDVTMKLIEQLLRPRSGRAATAEFLAKISHPGVYWVLLAIPHTAIREPSNIFINS